jgi:hypothetical protein
VGDAYPRYRLILREPDGTERTSDFRSLTGQTYGKGDELRVEPEGEIWRVAREEPAEEPFIATLICDRV